MDLADQVQALYKSGKRVVSIAGAIGAGKSTICREVVRELVRRGIRVKFVPEIVPKRRFHLYLADRKTHAWPFQKMMLSMRLVQLDEALAMIEANEVDLVVQERGPREDAIFFEANVAAGSINPNLRGMYYTNQAWAMEECKAVVAFVHITVPLDVCIHRMHRRAREGEIGAYETTEEDRRYFASIHAAYPKWLAELRSEGYAVLEFNNEVHDDGLTFSAKELDVTDAMLASSTDAV